MHEKEIQESGKVFALTMVLMNILILTMTVSIVWLIQIIVSQTGQMAGSINGFRM